MLTLDKASIFVEHNWTDARINEIFNKEIRRHPQKNYTLLLIGSPNDQGAEDDCPNIQ
jgi:hypothetical protein